ncbi:MAG: hypothetical protein ACP5HZ_01515, partial [Ferrimicrobium sp.]
AEAATNHATFEIQAGESQTGGTRTGGRGLSGDAVADSTPDEALERTQLLDSVQQIDSRPDPGGLGPMYEFGAHAAVIPGTEEFMSSLARKNRAFEHTGEIDTDLDRAADKLGWNRADDDIVAKRKIFKKKKRS